MVAQGDHVVAHDPQSPELGGVGRIDRLEEGAHGEVSGVHRDGGGAAGGLPGVLQGGGQPAIAAHIGGVGVKVVVGVVGEEDGQGHLGFIGPGRQGGQGGGEGQKQGKGHGRQAVQGFSHGWFLLFGAEVVNSILPLFSVIILS